MSRILVDLSDGQLDELAVIVDTQHRPRAAIIRDAIDAYIALHKHRLADDAFGLWKDRKIDGLAYQEELRAEW
ncbi:CopG family transcriptional regulator [Burkholderia sp. LMG 32019]|uniref:CopG family transcriptional regulator n=1 Tax=Burkholderia sp. LMG 32019 TaxID=3158173 RepID=UPI003C303D03